MVIILTNNKVSCFWQCGFSLVPIPLGLWAFHRIHKLKYGCLLYGISFIIINSVYFMHASLAYDNYDLSMIVYGFYITSILICAGFILYYIEKWSEEFNLKVESVLK